MKYFTISDTHAHHKETIEALHKAGFDINNDNHKLIVVGDITDRGSEALTHILWLKDLEDKGKAIILRGNHDSFIIGFLMNKNQAFNWQHNGLDTTIDDLDHRTNSFQTYCMIYDKPFNTDTFLEWERITQASINKEYPWLKKWFKSHKDYYETENYIFTHGIIDHEAEDWHKPTKPRYNYKGWDALHWASPEDFLEFKNNTGKHLVVGHLNASLMKYTLNHGNNDLYDYREYFPENEIYYDDRINTYFIDTLTAATKRVNVLVIEDKELEEEI